MGNYNSIANGGAPSGLGPPGGSGTTGGYGNSPHHAPNNEDMRFHGTELVMLYDYKVCLTESFSFLCKYNLANL